jgi:hypothetical protein
VAFLAAPQPVAHRALDVTLDVRDRWVRPNDTVVATAHAPPQARIAWLLAVRNPVASPNWPHAPGDPVAVPAGAERAATKLTDAGRYVLGLAGGAAPLLNVSVDPRLPAQLDAVVDAVDTPEGLRFVPDEATAGRNGLLVVRNHAAREVVLAERDWMGLLPAEGAQARFTMPKGIDLGDYELRVVATDASGAVGEARARLLFDLRKPDENATVGPFNGTLRAAAPPPVGAAPAEHPFTARHPIRELSVAFNASSGIPGPATVVVQVLGPEGKVLDTSEPSASGSLVLRDLPAGAYSLRVSPAQGAYVSYNVEARVRLLLVPPESFFGR